MAQIRDLLVTAGTWASRPSLVDAGLVVLAQATSGAADPILPFLNYGVLGATVVAFATGQFRSKAELTALQKTHDEDRARWDRKESRLLGQVDELVATYKDQALPALLASAKALEGSADQVAVMAAAVRRMEDVVDRAQALIRRQGG